jgi:hypothetical protein
MFVEKKKIEGKESGLKKGDNGIIEAAGFECFKCRRDFKDAFYIAVSPQFNQVARVWVLLAGWSTAGVRISRSALSPQPKFIYSLSHCRPAPRLLIPPSGLPTGLHVVPEKLLRYAHCLPGTRHGKKRHTLILFVGSKRKSSNNTPTQSTPPATAQSSQSPRSSQANSSTTSLPSGAPTPTGTMNPNQMGRPPSYSYSAQQPGQQLNAPPGMNQGRPHSPMPPPPIDTRAGQPAGYPPQQMYNQPPPQGPPGYAPQPQQQQQQYGAPVPYQAPTAPPAGPNSYNRPGAVEVEAAGRSKAQLIVGIDFVGGLRFAVLADMY